MIVQSPRTGAVPRAGGASRTAATRRLPLFLLREATLWALLYLAYFALRGETRSRVGPAVQHGRDVLRLERVLDLDWERSLQAAVLSLPGGRGFFSAYYELCFFPVVVAVLLWLALRHRDAYRSTRTAMLLALAASSVVFATFPTAPPRLLPGLAVLDTVGMGDHDTGTWHGISFNPYAAMPSMHVGWSLLVALAVARVAPRPALRVAACLHPALMVLAVTSTGNHYVLDCAAGSVVVLGALAVVSAHRPPVVRGRRGPDASTRPGSQE